MKITNGFNTLAISAKKLQHIFDQARSVPPIGGVIKVSRNSWVGCKFMEFVAAGWCTVK